ncbi:MAG TPA: hypothetical protein VLX68_04200 [Chitinivibrionales bacterium]|nr:hypothetical protein [Chitinivibrionales bacterium]
MVVKYTLGMVSVSLPRQIFTVSKPDFIMRMVSIITSAEAFCMGEPVSAGSWCDWTKNPPFTAVTLKSYRILPRVTEKIPHDEQNLDSGIFRS